MIIFLMFGSQVVKKNQDIKFKQIPIFSEVKQMMFDVWHFFLKKWLKGFSK